MTDTANAERLREYYLTHKPRQRVKNICTGVKNWNGCDYCDIYSGAGLECWKQDGKHYCVRVREETAKYEDY